MAEWTGLCSTDILVLEAMKDLADPAFLGFRLHTSDFIDHANATTEGVNHPRTSWNGISRFTLEGPPLQEQRAIAGVLSKLQGAVEAQDKIIATLKELKAATLAKLFREGLRGEPLKETEIGEIPESWEVVQIRSLGEIVTGTTPPTSDRGNYGGDIPFIAPGDLGEFRLVRAAQKALSEAGLRRSRALPPRSVLVVCIGSTIGKVGMTLAPASTTNQQINAVICREGQEPEFVHYLMLWNATRIANMATPSPVPILSKGSFGEISVAVPSDDQEAKEIAATLCAIDELMEARVKTRDAADHIFQSMLHLLMTGEVRVTALMEKVPSAKVAELPARYADGRLDESILQEIVRRIVEAVAPEKIILFGSAARAEMGPDSDVDLVVVKCGVHRRKTAQALHLKMRGIAAPVDLIVATPEDLERHKDTIGLIYRSALKEGKVIYAR